MDDRSLRQRLRERVGDDREIVSGLGLLTMSIAALLVVITSGEIVFGDGKVCDVSLDATVCLFQVLAGHAAKIVGIVVCMVCSVIFYAVPRIDASLVSLLSYFHDDSVKAWLVVGLVVVGTYAHFVASNEDKATWTTLFKVLMGAFIKEALTPAKLVSTSTACPHCDRIVAPADSSAHPAEGQASIMMRGTSSEGVHHSERTESPSLAKVEAE